jgi:predicted esterase
MSTYQNAREFLTDFYKLLRANQYEAALKLIEANHNLPIDHLTEYNFVRWMFNRMCVFARLGHIDEAIAQFQEAIDGGHWYQPGQLHDEDLKLLVGDPRYEELCKISAARYEKFASSIQPEVDIYPPTNDADKPSLLMALHGNGRNAALSYEAWKAAPEYGCLLAIPTSTQFYSQNSYVWDNFDKAELEIKHHYETLISQYDLDVGQTIIAGFSMGATLAIWATLNQFFPIKGFIVVGLFVRDLEDWINRLDGLKVSGLRGYFLFGEEEAFGMEDVKTLAREMQHRGILCDLDIRPGLGHGFPDDFDETLKRAIDFVSRAPDQ